MYKVFRSANGNLIPLFKQTAGYCGPTSLRMDAWRYGIMNSENHAAELCRATREFGVEWDDVARAAEEIGLLAEKQDCPRKRKEDPPCDCLKDLRRELRRGHTPLVDWVVPARKYHRNGETRVKWVMEGHYSVVAEMTAEHIYLADPMVGDIRKLSTNDDFLWLWHDSDSIPAQAQEEFYLHRMIKIWHPTIKPLPLEEILAIEAKTRRKPFRMPTIIDRNSRIRFRDG